MVGLERLVPGSYFGIKNCDYFSQQVYNGWKSDEDAMGALASYSEYLRNGTEFQEYFHGCSLVSLLTMIKEGFKPVLGAGCDWLKYIFKRDVPGVYLTKYFYTALHYPTFANTEITDKHPDGLPGGTIPCLVPSRLSYDVCAELKTRSGGRRTAGTSRACSAPTRFT